MSLLLKLPTIFSLGSKGKLPIQLVIRKISITPTNGLKAQQRGVTASAEQKYRKKDRVPATCQLIYRAPFEIYMKSAKNVTSLSAGLIGGIFGYKWLYGSQFIPLSHNLDISSLVAHESDIWWFASGFILINLAVSFFVSKYPLRIYQHEEQYFAIYDSLLPFMPTKTYTFARGDVGAVKQFFNPWSHIMYRLGNRTSLLLVDYFRKPSDFNYMFGLK